jgi:hypothetical protein
MAWEWVLIGIATPFAVIAAALVLVYLMIAVAMLAGMLAWSVLAIVGTIVPPVRPIRAAVGAVVRSLSDALLSSDWPRRS